MSIKFSIITAVYNRAQVIEQAISSVINQSYDNYEYIVIDGGSTDGTVDILKKYDLKIKWISEPDNGLYDALNKGIKMATGDYILVFGSDDCLHDYAVLQRAADEIEKNPETDFLCGNVYNVNDETGAEQFICNDFNKYDAAEPFHLHTVGVFIRAKHLNQELFDVNFRVCADMLFVRKCYYKLHCNFKYVNFPVTYFSMGGVSSISDYSVENEHCLNLFGFSSPQKTLWIKCKLAVWYVLDILGLKEKVHTMLHGHVYRKHHCTNKICRWCGRK